MSDLVDRVFARLGLSARPRPDLVGLESLYEAWCSHVPFDNLRKRISMARSSTEPLPGGRPDDFLAAFLEHGTGGTCWPSSNGLHALVAACGFEVRRISASMFDRNDHNHGSLVVRLDGAEWLVDSSMLCGAPIRLERERGSDDRDPVHTIRVEPAPGGLLVHWGMAQSTDTIPCRLMQDPVDEAFYLARYEISRGYSVFNNALYARKNFPGRLVSFVGRVRHEKTAQGVASRELALPELRRALVEELGYSRAIVDELERTAGFG
ncbi:MAG TPA: arylamine N-acetyltransferase [Myxococcota bacterium]|nr:arylamine N-acetyltransferase [Myxococcota bacterium]